MSAATASWPLRALLAAAALVTPGVALAAEGGGGSYVLTQLMPIIILLGTLALIITRLPKVEIQHSADYKLRRALNWLPMGFAYAFLYMGRYNLTVSKNEFSDIGLMNNADFGVIFGIGTVVYGVAFVLNGPLTDRFGGKKAMLVGATGAMVMNALMGAVTYEVLTTGGPGSLTALMNTIAAPFFVMFNAIFAFFGQETGDADRSILLPALSLLYAGNMYFQSFGAVAIVKVNAPWFHVRERGVFGAVFGVLISLGVFFAYDGGRAIVSRAETYWVFFTPAILLGIMAAVCLAFVRDTPGEAGFGDFDVGDASSGDDGPPLGVAAVFKKMLTNPVILTISAIEFCSGFLRQAIMQWYIIFAKQTGIMETFVPSTWGLLLCCAGIMGGAFAGVISDHLFQSRRGPVAAVLYGGLLGGALVMTQVLDSVALGYLVIFMSLCVIGVHGMLSGTASMDFGGRKNTGVAVGIIDGFVYLGTGVMSFLYGARLPNGEAAKDPNNWIEWPMWMIPIAIIGLLLSLRLWNAKPKGSGGGH